MNKHKYLIQTDHHVSQSKWKYQFEFHLCEVKIKLDITRQDEHRFQEYPYIQTTQEHGSI